MNSKYGCRKYVKQTKETFTQYITLHQNCFRMKPMIIYVEYCWNKLFIARCIYVWLSHTVFGNVVTINCSEYRWLKYSYAYGCIVVYMLDTRLAWTMNSHLWLLEISIYKKIYTFICRIIWWKQTYGCPWKKEKLKDFRIYIYFPFVTQITFTTFYIWRLI